MNIGKSITLVGGIITVILSVCGCNRPKGESDEETASTTSVRVPVRLSTLTQGDIESSITAVGSTDALRKEKVLSPIAGRIVSLKVLEGSPVHTGEVMVILRTREAQAAITGAQVLVRSATTEQQKEEAWRALALADSLQPQITLHAPFDGIVASRSVTEGELVADQTELLTVIDPSTIVFVADVPLTNVASIQTGLPARISFPSLQAQEFQAIVDAVNPQADLQSQSVRVRLRFGGLVASQIHILKSNVPGTARIITSTHHNVLLVQCTALLHDDETNTYSVVMMTLDSMAKVVPVTVGVQTDSIAEIHSDQLHSDQQVIVRGQYALTDSTKVTVEQR